MVQRPINKHLSIAQLLHMAVRSSNIWHGFTWQLLSPVVPRRGTLISSSLGDMLQESTVRAPGEVLHPSCNVLFAYEEMSLGQMAA